jgi:hypothetical protein
MAQLGESARARQLLRRAARAFGPGEALSRARCIAAEAEVALAERDLGWSPRALDQAIGSLDAHGDRHNAAYARLVAVRRLVLVGRIDPAEAALAEVGDASPSLTAIADLLRAEVALRRIRPREARAALERASVAASAAGIPALAAEVASLRASLSQPAARMVRAGAEEVLDLGGVAALFASGDLVIDACRRAIVRDAHVVSLARRPVLFALARVLGESPASRELLIERAFGARRINESHRARLRVEIGRLRAALAGLAGLDATPDGFALSTQARIAVLLPPIDGDGAALVALLADGQAWSTSALALALGQSQRTVQRALRELESAGAVRSLGRARAQRWLAPAPPGFATTLLLPHW